MDKKNCIKISTTLMAVCLCCVTVCAQFNKQLKTKSEALHQFKGNQKEQEKAPPKNTGENKSTTPAIKDNLLDAGTSLLEKKGLVSLDEETMSNGIRELLTTASDRTVKKLGTADGFMMDNTIKIDMPKDAEKVTSLLRKFGMGKMADDAVLSMNRAAETATSVCLEELTTAIKKMNIQDASTIMLSKDTAATVYLRKQCESSLAGRIKPIVEQSLEKVNATKYWDDVFSYYNRISRNKINPNLADYVNEKVMYALFMKIGQEEMRIRENPGEGAGKIINQILQRP